MGVLSAASEATSMLKARENDGRPTLLVMTPVSDPMASILIVFVVSEPGMLSSPDALNIEVREGCV